MKCPMCGRECKEGIVEIRGGAHLLEAATQIATTVLWYPKQYSGKRIKKDVVWLCNDAEGHYCDECMKVFAELEER